MLLVIIIGNATMFRVKDLWDFYKSLGMQIKFAIIVLLKTIGQVKSSNKEFLKILSPKLDAWKGKHVNKLPTMLYAYQTIPSVTIGESRFSLVYGSSSC